MSLKLPDNKVCLFSPNEFNPRMSAQQSVFTVAGRIGVEHDAITELVTDNTDALKIIIPKTFKQQLIYRLVKMNVMSTSLFPDITGIAKRTKDAIRHDPCYGLLEFTEDLERR